MKAVIRPAMSASLLKTWFPTISHPLIISAPMLGVSNGTLSAEVSKVSGLGMVQGGLDFTPNSAHLARVDEELTVARKILGLTSQPEAVLPIGVGFITYNPSISEFPRTAVPLLQKHKPAAIWLFAPRPGEGTHGKVIATAHEAGASWGLKVFVQVGTVIAAREAASDGADIIVAQGVDAGGHQWASGAGVISLVPEVKEMLRSEFPTREIPVVAAGGIADGSAVAAVLALGAEGAVMGTKFMVANETLIPEWKKKAVLNAKDGGSSTVKSYLHDHIQSNRSWPELYDGRALVHPSYHDEQSGVSLEDNVKRFNEAKEAGDLSRAVTWSGTGVGLVKDAASAGEIVKEVRNAARKRIQELKANL